jgi:two-component system response regulator PilR (NtrC family)
MDVLIVDDEPTVLSLLRTVLGRHHYGVVEADDGLKAIQALDGRSFDLVISDLRLPHFDGLQVLRHAREKHPRMPVVMLTGEGSIRECVEAMRAGASNFLTKPFHPQDLDEVVHQALHTGKHAHPVRLLAHGSQPQTLIGDSAALREVIDTMERIAHTNSTVLITGESGTGKEVVARLLHGSSVRAEGPLVAVNCGAIPEALIESELFGHSKGAFTGAVEARPGRFIEANGGTLFLDEIGELPLSVQVKLLRVLQDRRVTAVGASRARDVDLRIIAATNRDLEAMVRAGTFRADLYYRLDVLAIRLPALRERREDIPLLISHFLDLMNRRFGRGIAIGPEALTLMKSYDWPGNVREMENLVERLVILSRGDTIGVEALPERFRSNSSAKAIFAAATVDLTDGGIDLQETVLEFERTLIERALRLAEGNKTRAAMLLDLSRTTLLDKLKRQVC